MEPSLRKARPESNAILNRVILEALRAPSNQVLLLQYGIPGSTVGLQWTTNVASGVWQPSPSVTQTNLVQAAGTFTPSLPALFFRALR